MCHRRVQYEGTMDVVCVGLARTIYMYIYIQILCTYSVLAGITII